jgi:hypothetical protein
MPGTYTVKFTANGKTWSQPLTIRMDPRVKTALPDLQLQFRLAWSAYKGRERAMASLDKVQTLRAAIARVMPKANGDLPTKLRNLDAKMAALAEQTRRGRGGSMALAGDHKSFYALENDYAGIFGILEETDMPPTMQTQTALQTTDAAAKVAEASWTQLQSDITNLNAQLQAAGLGSLSQN